MPGSGCEGPEKILIVEDDPVSLRSLVALFVRDYDLTVATSGKDALVLAGPGHKLFLLDLNLPDMDGFDLLRKFQEDERLNNIPAIFITASQDISTEEAGIRLGAVDFITKPFSPAVLRARVRLHLDLRSKTEQLELLARQDGLTGLANRRQFDDVCPRAWRRAKREKTPLAVIMADIDHFKQVNDRYGHPVGDATLREVANILSQEIYRPSDFTARYGGEEFVIILHNTDLSGAALVAERIRAAVEERFRLTQAASDVSAGREDLPENITISLGCAAVVPEGEGAPDLLRAADDALNLAKENGRNQVVCGQVL